MSNPMITKVYLLDTPLEGDYENTLYFDSKEAQTEYFLSKVRNGYTFTDFSYQRKDGFIRVPMHIDKLYNCNYVMYQNTAYSNKWFYAFITDMVYISGNEDGTDGRTDVYIQTDVIQTWLFDYEVLPSFVEREHTASDEIGEHTYPEGLETGEYKCNIHTTENYLESSNVGGYGLDQLDVVIASTIDIASAKEGEKVQENGKLYNGIYSGVTYTAIALPDHELDEGAYKTINKIFNKVDEEGWAEAIKTIFIAPRSLTGNTSGSSKEVAESKEPIEYDILCDKFYYMDGHNVRNKKLYCYPYNYLLVSNNNGGNAIYQYEHFTDSTIPGQMQFRIKGVLTPGCAIRMTPINYKGAVINDEEGINLGKFPICNWNSDAYTNWLTQNSVNIGVSVATGLATVAAGAAMVAGVAAAPVTGGASLAITAGTMAGGAMTAASGVAQVGSTIGQVYQQSFTPPQAKGNLNAGDVITAGKTNTFHFYSMSIKKEYAEIIDSYFDLYGYKVCKVKKPEENHRETWWYTKTVNVNIDGPIPGKDMQTIKDCYNRGIRFWRHPDYVGRLDFINGIRPKE